MLWRSSPLLVRFVSRRTRPLIGDPEVRKYLGPVSNAEKNNRKRMVRTLNKFHQRELRENAIPKGDPIRGDAKNPFVVRMQSELNQPHVLVQGLENRSVERMLFGAMRHEAEEVQPQLDAEATAQLMADEERRREAVLRCLLMANADGPERRKAATAVAVKEFQREEGDTGLPEVQAAVLTVKILAETEAMHLHKHDHQGLRLLRMAVQKRQRILRYLKRDNPERYYWALAKLGLTDGLVHMEFSLSGQDMVKYGVVKDKVVKVTDRAKDRAKKREREDVRYAALKKEWAANSGVRERRSLLMKEAEVLRQEIRKQRRARQRAGVAASKARKAEIAAKLAV